MNSQNTGRNGNTPDSVSITSKASKHGPSHPRRFQFEPPESIAEESSGSFQNTGNINVRAVKRSRSHLTIGSHQRLIDPAQFSLQNPWTRGPVTVESPPGKPPVKLHKSVSAASLATVKRLLKRDKSQLIDFPTGHATHVVPSNLPHESLHHTIHPDFSSSFTPTEIVIQPQRRHSRIAIVTKPDTPLSIGGGLLFGEVSVSVITSKDSTSSVSFGIGYLSVDLVGVESCNKRHNVFQSLAVDLIDHDRPPPAGSTPSLRPSADGFWEMVPTSFIIPFHLQLPENPGPPPYKSRHGSIRYLLSATAIVRNGSEETIVRDTCDITVLSLHSARLSLVNLPQPLNATEMFVLSRGLPFQDLSLRASLGRDVWASGMSLFVDIHIRNRTLRPVIKVNLSLERVMMVYHHSIAQLDQGLRRQSRLPDKIHRKTVASQTTTKSNIGWRGIAPLARDSRTWMLDLPSGLATINTGRFFGVRYFLKISLHLAYMTKTFEAQLPITILDPNSLDIASEFESLHVTSSRPRPSTLDSDLPDPSQKEMFTRRAEHKTPNQTQRQRRETWAWVTELSPHPSLVPSPLLPAYGIPSRTGKTPSRLRVENKFTDKAMLDIPGRLRPPMDEHTSSASNRGYQAHTSDYPISSTNVTGSSDTTSQNPRNQPAIGSSAIASLRNHLQGPRRVVAGNQRPELLKSELDRGNIMEAVQHTDRSFVANTEHLDLKPRQSPQGLRVVPEDGLREDNKSPARYRKPLPHRRAISRSKDVRAIYRPLSKDNNRQYPGKSTDHNGPENGWETVENFF